MPHHFREETLHLPVHFFAAVGIDAEPEIRSRRQRRQSHGDEYVEQG